MKEQSKWKQYPLSAAVRESLAAYGSKEQGMFTLDDYDRIPDQYRVELIDGVFYDLAAPLNIHQAILQLLSTAFGRLVEDHQGSCFVYPAPFDVQLDCDDRTMVQPDLSIICDRNRLVRRGCYGAPDLIVEILSESTAGKDRLLKLNKYKRAGVREYWIVDPDKRTVQVFHDLVNSDVSKIYTFGEKIPVGIWNNKWYIDFAKIGERIGILYDL
ncbi:MAG: Uma2 family endonuclease [Eubacterium sp.]|nr:Uma2 family endonuclease [Eubacterium sp.]